MKHRLIIGCICSVLFFACKKDEKIGPPAPVAHDYQLPQGNASAAANDRIQQLYDTYGSYFLYVFTQKDFVWVPSTGGAFSKIDTAVLGKPEYVMDMLNFLDDIWLKFLPDSFKKAQGIPYRVLLADTIKTYRGPGYPPGMEYLYSDYKVIDKAICFAGMNDSLRKMTPADKVKRKNIFTGAIWNYYLQNKIIEIPAAFYKLTDYVTTPATPNTPANLEAFRQRGFLPASYSSFNGAAQEWYYGTFSWGTAQSSDAGAYLFHLTTRTDAQMEPFLKYPLIKQKFDFLVTYFKSKYNIDVRAIANATY